MKGLIIALVLFGAISIGVSKCQERETRAHWEQMSPKDRQAWTDLMNQWNAELDLCNSEPHGEVMACREFVIREQLRPFKEAMLKAMREKYKLEEQRSLGKAP